MLPATNKFWVPELAKLNNKATRMEKSCVSYITCKEQRKLLFNKKGYPILECKKCGHRFIEIPDQKNHLSNVYSDDYFFAGKDGYPNYLNGKDLLYDRGIRYARLIAKYIQGRERYSMLDLPQVLF